MTCGVQEMGSLGDEEFITPVLKSWLINRVCWLGTFAQYHEVYELVITNNFANRKI